MRAITAILVLLLAGSAYAAEPEKPKEPTVEELAKQVKELTSSVIYLKNYSRILYEARDVCEVKMATMIVPKDQVAK